MAWHLKGRAECRNPGALPEVSSHQCSAALCLVREGTGADNGRMSHAAEHIYDKTCEKCERPALTFDRENRALCAHHATIFIMAPHSEPEPRDDR